MNFPRSAITDSHTANLSCSPPDLIREHLSDAGEPGRIRRVFDGSDTVKHTSNAPRTNGTPIAVSSPLLTIKLRRAMLMPDFTPEENTVINLLQ